MKKFKPAFTCRRASRYNKELVSVRLRNGMYAILKYVDGYWKLGSLKFRNKEENEIQEVNVFKHNPQWENNHFIIEGRTISTEHLSFTQIVIYIDLLHSGIIRKDYIKKIPAP